MEEVTHGSWSAMCTTSCVVTMTLRCLMFAFPRSSYYQTYRLTDMESSKTREVVQFHYTTWPDFGIPSSPVAFLQFLKEVRESGALDKDVGPPIIHCSAGIGRSGTFCLVDCCLVLVSWF